MGPTHETGGQPIVLGLKLTFKSLKYTLHKMVHHDKLKAQLMVFTTWYVYDAILDRYGV